MSGSDFKDGDVLIRIMRRKAEELNKTFSTCWDNGHASSIKYHGGQMNSILDKVEKWYRENAPQVSAEFESIKIHSNAPDSQTGSIGIALETKNTMATITFWVKGDVSAIGIQ